MTLPYGSLPNGLFAWMTIYLPELFPTRVRGSAISLVFDSSRIVPALGPLLAGWLFAGPETKGKPLPE